MLAANSWRHTLMQGHKLIQIRTLMQGLLAAQDTGARCSSLFCCLVHRCIISRICHRLCRENTWSCLIRMRATSLGSALRSQVGFMPSLVQYLGP